VPSVRNSAFRQPKTGNFERSVQCVADAELPKSGGWPERSKYGILSVENSVLRTLGKGAGDVERSARSVDDVERSVQGAAGPGARNSAPASSVRNVACSSAETAYCERSAA